MKTYTIIFLIMFSSLMAAQGTNKESVGKFSGYMIGDYYYNISQHNQELKDKHGFWFRRIYFTYDYNINSSFSTRLRMEMSNDGKYASAVAMTPVVKDAYLAYKFGNQKTYFGISPTPTFSLIEKVWGYRSVEKTALDQQRMASSRDFGVALKGKLDAAGKLNYFAMIGNGSSNKQEIDKGKSFMASISYWASKDVVLELYGDYADRAGKADTYIAQAFLGYNSKKLHGGVQYAHQILKSKDDETEESSLSVLSAFMSGNIAKNIKLIGRIDRMLDPNPVGNKVAFTPYNQSASFTEIIAGVDVQVDKNVSIIPNVKFVKYDTNDAGIEPESDTYARVTMYWKFK